MYLNNPAVNSETCERRNDLSSIWRLEKHGKSTNRDTRGSYSCPRSVLLFMDTWRRKHPFGTGLGAASRSLTELRFFGDLSVWDTLVMAKLYYRLNTKCELNHLPLLKDRWKNTKEVGETTSSKGLLYITWGACFPLWFPYDKCCEKNFLTMYVIVCMFWVFKTVSSFHLALQMGEKFLHADQPGQELPPGMCTALGKMKCFWKCLFRELFFHKRKLQWFHNCKAHLKS